MLKIQPKQHIRFATIEKSMMWVVVAVLVESRDGEDFVVSEPKIIRVILKERKLALSKGVISKALCLSVSNCISSSTKTGVISPFVSFLYTKSSFVIWFSARPPTF